MRVLRGFTLTELLVSITIVIILSAISAPYLGQFTQNARVTSTSNDLLSMINIARSEAIRRNVPVTLCALTKDGTCVNSAGLSQSVPYEPFGWAVFEDNAIGNSGLYGITDKDKPRVIRRNTVLPTNLFVRGTFGYVMFSPMGRALLDGVSTSGAIKVCLNAAGSGSTGGSCLTTVNVRCIALSAGGSPTVTIPSVASSGVLNAGTGAGGGCT